MARNRSKRSRDISKTVMDRVKESSTLFVGKIRKFTPSEDTYKLIILPFEAKLDNSEVKAGTLYYRLRYFQHRDIGPEGNTKKYNCPSTFLEDCPIDEDIAQLREDYAKNEDIIGKYRKKYRELYNIILLEDAQKVLAGKADWSDVIQVLDISWHGFGKLLETRIDSGEAEEELAKFANYGKGGRILKVVFSEYSFSSKPSKKKGKSAIPVQATIIDFLKRPFELDEEELLQNVYQLDEILVIPKYETLRKAYFELDDEDNETEEEDNEAPFETSKRKKSLKKEEEEEEKTEEEEEEAEEEEEEAGGEEEEEEEEIDEFDNMDRSELKKFIRGNDLNDYIKVFTKDSDDDIRDKIRDHLYGPDLPEQMQDQKPKKKSSDHQKSATKKSKNKSSCPKGYDKNEPFGACCGDYEDCDDCKIFDQCMEARVNLD